MIFISYHIAVDQPVASALKKLIETSLDPAPKVFVSGDGGLRPAATGFRDQLQRAAGQAKAFVGIITHASKDREWLIYEAGAAFGLGLLYCPLLVGVDPKDLPDTLSDRQAVRASDEKSMKELMESLAQELKAIVKPNFARRYGIFQRALVEKRTPADWDADLENAVRLIASGDVKAADELLSPLERNRATPAILKAEFQVMRIVASPGRTLAEYRKDLDACDDRTRASPAWQFCAGMCESAPEDAISHLRSALFSPEVHRWKLPALAMLHHKLFQLGRIAESLELAKWGLRHEEKRARSAAAFMLGASRTDFGPFLRLLLLAYSDQLSPQSRALASAVTLAQEQHWDALGLSLARRLAATKDDSRQQLGRAYYMLGLPSLAYDTYKFAIARGSSTARVGLAMLLKYGDKVPAAAVLEPLAGHSGPFDVDDTAMPHRLRAEAEGQVRKESARADAITARGKTAIDLLLKIVDGCVRSECASGPLPPRLYDGRGEAIVQQKGDGRYVVRPRLAPEVVLECPIPFLPLWVSSSEVRTGIFGQTAKPVRGVYEQLASGDLQGVQCYPVEQAPAPADHQWHIAPR